MSHSPLSGFSSNNRDDRKPNDDRRGKDGEAKEKPFRIQKKRLGEIKFMKEDGEFGFIQAEDFREDVFFHKMAWDSENNLTPRPEMYVEFELDDDHYEENKKLRAKVVRPTGRPAGRTLKASDAPFEFTYHHPKARRKRPTWRDNQ
ncbi:Cold shock protein, CspA family [Neorhodopirellula lusitana]|uniref:Cold shock protein, CspA family n=1 Tax=Neorhodopirellula lusitana TaxID=445327 RepID=A0ABY1Q273_9BACT|nr:cold shock domain-containing protein [Neorhodopirellula lusitana]SMP56877.1 Cold shock protein, CspA family [Neorhodopirellula lusitana]